MEIFDGWDENNLPPIGITFLSLWSNQTGKYVKCYSIGYTKDGSLTYQLLEGNCLGDYKETNENKNYFGLIRHKPLPETQPKEIRSIIEDDTIIHQNKIQCIHDKLSGKYNEQLFQLAQRPIYDGDVISKTNRDFLIKAGLAVKVCNECKQDYTSATSIAYSILKKRGYIV